MTNIQTGESREDRRVDPRLSALAKAETSAESRADWSAAKLAFLDEQLSRRTVLRGDGQFWLARWAATQERFYLRLLTHTEEKKVRQADEKRPGKSKLTGEKKVRPSIELGAGPVWLFLALMSWRRSDLEKNERNIVSVAIERRDDGTGKKGEGPLALRSGLNPKTIRDYLSWLQVGDPDTTSLKIVRITPNFGPGGVSGYDWDGDLTSVILRMAKPNLPAGTKIEHPLQLSARIVVAALVLRRMNRGKGRVSLTRRDLVATGLNFKVAMRELNWLLKNRFFIRIGSGMAALPEMVQAGAYRAAPSGRFWDHNGVKKASGNAKTLALRDPPENAEMELRDPPDDTISALRDPPVLALRDHPIPQEVIPQEERDSVRSTTTTPPSSESEGLVSADVLPLSPTDGSAQASPPSGEAVAELPANPVERIGHGLDVDRVGRLIAVVGNASPTAPGKHLRSIGLAVAAIEASLRDAGLSWQWAEELIGIEAARLAELGFRFGTWGVDKPHGVRSLVQAAVRRHRSSGLGPATHRATQMKADHLDLAQTPTETPDVARPNCP